MASLAPAHEWHDQDNARWRDVGRWVGLSFVTANLGKIVPPYTQTSS